MVQEQLQLYFRLRFITILVKRKNIERNLPLLLLLLLLLQMLLFLSVSIQHLFCFISYADMNEAILYLQQFYPQLYICKHYISCKYIFTSTFPLPDFSNRLIIQTFFTIFLFCLKRRLQSNLDLTNFDFSNSLFQSHGLITLVF